MPISHASHIGVRCTYMNAAVSEDSDHLQLIRFWPSRAPGKGICGGAKFFGSALLQPARSACVSLSARISLYYIIFFNIIFYYNIFRVAAGQCGVRETNPRPIDRKSSTPPLYAGEPRRHEVYVDACAMRCRSIFSEFYPRNRQAELS